MRRGTVLGQSCEIGEKNETIRRRGLVLVWNRLREMSPSSQEHREGNADSVSPLEHRLRLGPYSARAAHIVVKMSPLNK